MEDQIYRWLEKTYHIRAPTEWLTECIDWLREDENTPEKDIGQCVYQQWLLANLHDLGCKCLEPNLNQTKDKVIRGYFPLQIDSLLDISKPAYQQHLKLKGSDDSNAKVSADKDEKVDCYRNINRLLQMKLTDGFQDICGLEYQPIPSLNTNLPPGTKVLIQGEIRCRNGTLLLTEKNLVVLGGEVTEIFENNAQSAVLLRKLNISAQQDHDQTPAVLHTPYTNNTRESPRNGDMYSEMEAQFNVEFGDKINLRSASTSVQQRSSSVTIKSSKPNTEYDADWDEDDDALLTVDLSNISRSSQVPRASQPSPEFDDMSDEEFERILNSAKINHKLQKKIVKISSPPFVYLDSLPSVPSDFPFEAIIKGFVISFLSGLGYKDGQSWTFKVLLNDGTGCINAQFSNEVLTGLIGMNVQDFKKLKQSSKSNPKSKEQVDRVLERLSRQIMDLSCLFEIQAKPNNDFVVITKLADITQEALDYFESWSQQQSSG